MLTSQNKLTKAGRHVGLDFYDLLIEALIDPESVIRSIRRTLYGHSLGGLPRRYQTQRTADRPAGPVGCRRTRWGTGEQREGSSSVVRPLNGLGIAGNGLLARVLPWDGFLFVREPWSPCMCHAQSLQQLTFAMPSLCH